MPVRAMAVQCKDSLLDRQPLEESWTQLHEPALTGKALRKHGLVSQAE
jgi:hypothetical protein